MKQTPINTDKDGCAFTIRAVYGKAGPANLMHGGGHYPMTGVITMNDEGDTCNETDGGR